MTFVTFFLKTSLSPAYKRLGFFIEALFCSLFCVRILSDFLDDDLEAGHMEEIHETMQMAQLHVTSPRGPYNKKDLMNMGDLINLLPNGLFFQFMRYKIIAFLLSKLLMFDNTPTTTPTHPINDEYIFV